MYNCTTTRNWIFRFPITKRFCYFSYSICYEIIFLGTCIWIIFQIKRDVNLSQVLDLIKCTHLKVPDEVRPSVLVPSLSCCRGSSHAVHPRKPLYAQYANFLFSKLARHRGKRYIFFYKAASEDYRRWNGTIFGRSRSGYDRIYLRFGTCKEASDSARDLVLQEVIFTRDRLVK